MQGSVGGCPAPHPTTAAGGQAARKALAGWLSHPAWRIVATRVLGLGGQAQVCKWRQRHTARATVPRVPVGGGVAPSTLWSCMCPCGGDPGRCHGLTGWAGSCVPPILRPEEAQVGSPASSPPAAHSRPRGCSPPTAHGARSTARGQPPGRGPPLLLGDHQDVAEQEQVAGGPAGEFPEQPGLFHHEQLPALQQPAGGRDQREGLGDRQTDGHPTPVPGGLVGTNPCL